MSTRKRAKSASAKKTQAANVTVMAEEAPNPVRQFEESFNNYLKEIGSIYQNGLKQYEDLINEYAKKADEAVKGVGKEREKVNAGLNDSVKEAWRKSDSNLKIAEVQVQSMRDLSEIHQAESKEAEKMQTELLEKILQLNKRGKAAYAAAFAKHNAEIKNKWRDLDDDLEAASLYILGYLHMASAYYGHITTSD
jgi:hypothetical protein